ncbi:phage tail family protein [Clostridium sporogenes]|uniref:phage tail family protein n=1 Tax=Clostridium sporogenes TaxID=1509 RepID=UPI0013CFD2DE|nr:phage tail family protein [Clostridium sporogenes]MDU5010699.1 phage tail family protein [Clostridium botulinum]MDU5116925.1 phage tail family protein [Clostridium botulinum]NFH33217.1 phage tail family protein [Clostridium sporogenes]NFL20198.1 phage tail family protein [Clostridium sporogenes]NFN71792.1 phage tail family protein [Clostridium sporogenes]
MQKIIFKNERGQSIELGNSAPFILTKIELGSPKTTILTSKSPGQDGKTHHGTFLDERILPIEGAIVGDTVEDMYRKRQKLCSIFNPKINGTLTYINNASEHVINCIVDSSPTFREQIDDMQEFLIQFYCPNPLWMDLIEEKEEIALWVGDFHFPLIIPEETGIIMGHRISNLIVNAKNKGDVECGMRIEFRALATVVNPSLFDVYTRKYIKVKRTLQAGDKLVINTSFGNKRVEMIKSNGTKINVFNYIDLASEFLQLKVGDNLLRYDSEKGLDNLEMALYYKPLYIGV